jgi:hypothetical protein
VAGTTTLTLPAATDTLVGKATTDTLTNKTLTTPTISSLSSASATALTLQSAGTTAITVDTSQNVGIGTASPVARLQAVGTDGTAGATNTVLRLLGNIGGANKSGGLFFRTLNSTTVGTERIALIQSTDADNNDRVLALNSTGGNVLIGTATNNASGGVLQVSNGITFPATQSASSDANTLDDYEEGTWTPSVGGNATYSLQAGGYTKIGRMVYVTGAMAITSLGTGSTGTLSGLPFTSVIAGGANCVVQIGYFFNLAVNVIAPWGFLNNSANSFTIYSLTTAGTNLGSALAVFGNSARIDFQLSYPVAT